MSRSRSIRSKPAAGKWIPLPMSYAQFPVLYRLDQNDANICVWFTDMGYTLRYTKPAFRYGMCRDADGPWQLYRLKRFIDNERQLLPAFGSVAN